MGVARSGGLGGAAQQAAVARAAAGGLAVGQAGAALRDVCLSCNVSLSSSRHVVLAGGELSRGKGQVCLKRISRLHGR